MSKKPLDPAQSPLAKVVTALYAVANERAHSPDEKVREQAASHEFDRGAKVKLKRTRDTNAIPVWRLRVSRVGKFPGDTEMQTFRDYFGVAGLFSQEQQMWTDKDSNAHYAYVMQWRIREESPAPDATETTKELSNV